MGLDPESYPLISQERGYTREAPKIGRTQQPPLVCLWSLLSCELGVSNPKELLGLFGETHPLSLVTKLIPVSGCFNYSRTVSQSSSGSALLSRRYLHFRLHLRSTDLLKISRANLAGVFLKNPSPALSQYEKCSSQYIFYRFFPIGFGKGMRRRNLSSSHSDSQASTGQVCRWEPCVRVLIYRILLPCISSTKPAFPWARSCNSFSCHWTLTPLNWSHRELLKGVKLMLSLAGTLMLQSGNHLSAEEETSHCGWVWLHKAITCCPHLFRTEKLRKIYTCNTARVCN